MPSLRPALRVCHCPEPHPKRRTTATCYPDKLALLQPARTSLGPSVPILQTGERDGGSCSLPRAVGVRSTWAELSSRRPLISLKLHPQQESPLQTRTRSPRRAVLTSTRAQDPRNVKAGRLLGTAGHHALLLQKVGLKPREGEQPRREGGRPSFPAPGQQGRARSQFPVWPLCLLLLALASGFPGGQSPPLPCPQQSPGSHGLAVIPGACWDPGGNRPAGAVETEQGFCPL